MWRTARGPTVAQCVFCRQKETNRIEKRWVCNVPGDFAPGRNIALIFLHCNLGQRIPLETREKKARRFSQVHKYRYAQNDYLRNFLHKRATETFWCKSSEMLQIFTKRNSNATSQVFKYFENNSHCQQQEPI